MSTIHRSDDRRAVVTLRMSLQARRHLQARAAAQGISVQLLIERALFDPEASPRCPGPSQPNLQQELPMTG